MMLYELSCSCREENAPHLSELLLEELGALSVTVEDAQAGSDTEQALFAEPDMPPPKQAWSQSKLLALFDSEKSAQQAWSILFQQSGCEPAQEGDPIRAVPEQDWVRVTQSQFAPIEITPHFYIVPSWHQKPSQAKTVMELDPGMAFGTGSHPTTFLCLQWLAGQSLAGKRVLDYGCGSGVLAIAAALLGAQEVVAVDIDPAASEACIANADKNKVQIHTGLPEMALERRQNGYDIVIANILSNPLKVLAPLLSSMLAQSGTLVLSGILERQALELELAYAPYAPLTVAASLEGWVLMRM